MDHDELNRRKRMHGKYMQWIAVQTLIIIALIEAAFGFGLIPNLLVLGVIGATFWIEDRLSTDLYKDV